MPEVPPENPPGFTLPRQFLSDPVPVESPFNIMGFTALAVLGGGAFLFLASAMFGRTAGARHSARLKWQERKDRARAEIEARVEESEQAEKKTP